MSRNRFRMHREPGRGTASFAQLLSSTSIGLFIALAGTKLWALYGGVDAIGLYGVLVGIGGVVAIMTGAGVHQALIRASSARIGAGDPRSIAALEWSAGRIVAAGVAVVLPALVWGSAPLAALLGDRGLQDEVICAGVYGAGIAVHVLASSTAVGRRETQVVARMNILGPTALNVVSVTMLVFTRNVGLALASGAWAGAALTVVMAVRCGSWCPRSCSVGGMAIERRFVIEGLPFMGSVLIGTGVIQLLPTLVFAQLGADEAALFRASLTIVLSGMGVFLIVIGQDQYPRLSRVADDRVAFVAELDRQIRLFTKIGVVVSTVGIVFAQPVVSVAFSHDFVQASVILQWAMVGGAARLGAWILAYGLLARGRSRRYLVAEVSSAAAVLMGVGVAIREESLAGLGIALAVSSFVHLGATVCLSPDVPRRALGKLLLASAAVGSAAILIA